MHETDEVGLGQIALPAAVALEPPKSRGAPAWSFALALGLGIAVANALARWPHRARGMASRAAVVSFSTLNQYDPRSNLYAWAASLSLLTALFLLAARAPPLRSPGGSSRFSAMLSPIRRGIDALAAAVSRYPLAVALLTLTALLAYVANVTIYNPAAGVGDGFHEGEFLGFAPAFRQLARPFEATFFIHGFALNALPGLLADTIAGARLVRMGESAANWLALLWLAYEVARSADERLRIPALAATLLAFCLLRDVSFFIAAPRSVFSFAGTAALLRLLRGREVTPRRALGVGLVAASAPLSFLFNFSEAGAFAMVFGVAAVLAALRGRRFHFRWWMAAFAGGALGCLIVLALVGPRAISTQLEEMAYWARHGGPIWFTPLSQNRGMSLRYYWVILAGQAGAFAALLRRGMGRDALARISTGESDLCCLVALSVGSMKTWVDRADEAHLALGAIPATLLLISLLLRSRAGNATLHPGALLAAAALCVLGPARRSFDPFAAAASVRTAVASAGTPDEKLLSPDVRAAAVALRADIQTQPCFYTLASDAVWYQLFDKPSCSRFHQLIYARTQEAQEEVVRSLANSRPALLLARSDSVGMGIDGVPLSVSNPIVIGHVLKWYRPYRRFGAFWFWKRAQRPLRSSGSVADGVILPPRTGRNRLTLVEGSGARPGDHIYARAGEDLLEDTEVSATGVWSMLLPPSIDGIRLAVYDDRTDSLLDLAGPSGPISYRPE